MPITNSRRDPIAAKASGMTPDAEMNKPAYSLSAGGGPLWNSGSQVVELRKRTFVHLVDLATYTHNQPFEAHCA